MAQNLGYTVLDLLESTARNLKAQPLNLGGVGGTGGGVGGPPGGFIGQLPQYRVTYDQTEAATLDTLPSGLNPPSGWSIVDNLNHIRYRLQVLESGGGTAITVMDYDGVPTVSNVDTIIFSGATIVDLGDGNVLVVVGSGSGGASDDTYLRLDTANDPLTNQLSIVNDNDAGGGLYVQTRGNAATGDFQQLGYADEIIDTPVLFLYRGPGDASAVDYIEYQLELWEDNSNFPALSDEGGSFVSRLGGEIYTRFSPRAILNNYMFNTLNNPPGHTIFSVQHDTEEVFHVTGSGWVFDIDGRLVSEAPITGSGYMRKDGAWVLASGGSGFGENTFYVDQSGGTLDTYGVLSGSINGSNTVFTVSKAKYVSGSLMVYLNGQLQTQGTSEDWVETSPTTGTFTFNIAPLTGDLITVDYLYSVVATGNADTVDGYHASSFVLDGNWFEFNQSGKYLEFGTDVGGKETNAGKIGYGTFDSGKLNIVGGGTTAGSRTVKLYDNLEVGSDLSSSAMNLTNPSQTYNINGTAHTHDDRYSLADGWFSKSETWTRTGNYTFTVSGDLTAIYRKYTKVRYKDGGSYEYGVVQSSSHAAGTTTVTLITNSDYAMAAATITDKYVSYVGNPEGFPSFFNFTTTVTPGAGSITSYTASVIWYTVEKGIKVDLVITITNAGTGTGAINAVAPFTNSVSVIGAGRENALTGKMLQGIWSGANTISMLDYANGGICVTNHIIYMSIISPL